MGLQGKVAGSELSGLSGQVISGFGTLLALAVLLKLVNSFDSET